MRTPMPYVPGEIRKFLLQHEAFTELLHGGKVTTREVPDPLIKPHVTVATVGHVGDDPMLRRLMIQVTPWVPGRDASGLDEDPDVTAWNLAATAGELIGRAKNIVIDDEHAWSSTWVDGPIQLYDTERSADKVLYYAPVRFQVHLRRRAQII
ncbi:hypothetical protein EU799_04745 [Corynebacterium silvaticum]|uniref:hypothetical protein n=1 Tax=Corynebacterium silvaticum TaxID=2320431 RepID=UPI001067C35A|nr:hypothetical protein [Corynebacterium silvaticum]MBH5301151.1 hypothetical protein [Corynebacterium silvaticum]NOM65351.1 hypothetical protein [Corynebacterium silvaticum]TFA92642.1 hypothetical protein EU802_04560 [Corynebacterium silvaticum]TFA96327.1 hypothetical protein EU799_04745 [Corynebacterium silvaticum]TNX84220.1 hypothetical protein FIT55_06635 [Corynebacterium silvaticum]